METATGLPTEILLLGWSAVLLFVQMVLQTGSEISETGPWYAFTARDEQYAPKGLISRRLRRAYHNLLETYPVFVALALALAVTGQTGGIGALGAHLWLWGRVAYVPLYALGVPLLRTLAWIVALVGLILMLVELLA
jgi:uncharacterized MAPEG superfamily protein